MKPLAIVAPIVLLLLVSRPAAIFLGVWTVYINAIQRVTPARPLAHVGKKLREVMPPLIAHGNPSAAIQRVFQRLGVVAAADGPHPRPELWRLPGPAVLARRVSMFQQSCAMHFGAHAVTTPALPAQKIAGIELLGAAAIASTHPTARPHLIQDNQSTVSLSGGELSRSHERLYTGKVINTSNAAALWSHVFYKL
jgi:hypothetical protein